MYMEDLKLRFAAGWRHVRGSDVISYADKMQNRALCISREISKGKFSFAYEIREDFSCLVIYIEDIYSRSFHCFRFLLFFVVFYFVLFFVFLGGFFVCFCLFVDFFALCSLSVLVFLGSFKNFFFFSFCFLFFHFCFNFYFFFPYFLSSFSNLFIFLFGLVSPYSSDFFFLFFPLFFFFFCVFFFLSFTF